MPSRRLARRLAALARACGVGVAAGPGCFLFFPCDDGTHLETRPVTTASAQWSTVDAPGGPFTGSALEASYAWLVGPAGVAVSLDDGLTWAAQPGMPAGLVAIDGDSYSGVPTWAVGAGGLLGSVAVDGFAAVDADTDADLTAVALGPHGSAVAVGAGGVVTETYDGVTWAASTVTEADLLAVAELFDRTVWVSGTDGELLRRDDGMWEVVPLDTTADLVALAFGSGDRGMVAGADGAVWVTEDAGDTWTAAGSPGEIDAVMLAGGIAGAEDRFAAGPDGILWKFNGFGWVEVASVDASITTMVGQGGTIVAAGDGAVLRFGDVLETHEETFEVANCQPYVGRPYVVEGEPRLAPVTGNPEDPWLRQAREEHASVAAFARFVLQLLAVGAPPDLVADAIAAQADELRHAQACLERSGGTLGPLDIGEGVSASTLRDVALATAREGCITETASAWIAARNAEEPRKRDVWQMIARDETRHAALAWRFLRWALARDPELAVSIAPVFAARPPSVPPLVWGAVIAPAARGLGLA